MATTINATNLAPCQVIQGTIDQAFQRHPGAALTPVGAYDALVAPINRTAFIQSVNNFAGGAPSGSSKRTVQVRYVPASCEEEQEEIGRCEFTTSEPVFKTANLTVDDTFTWGFNLDDEEYRDLCDGDTAGIFAQMIQAKYQRAKKEFNKRILDALVLLPGNYPTNGDDSLTSPIYLPIVTTAGTYLPTGFGLLKSIYNASDIYEDPIIVAGRGIPDLALNSLRYSAMNTVPGYNVPGGLPNFFSDGGLNDAFGDGSDHLLTWAPGAIQLLEWYQNEGRFGWKTPLVREVNGTMVNGWQEDYSTLVMPDGIKWDFFYKFDCGVHYYKFRKVFGVAPMPSDAFGTCRDYNYILNFLATCGTLDCTDITNALATPATSS